MTTKSPLDLESKLRLVADVVGYDTENNAWLVEPAELHSIDKRLPRLLADAFDALLKQHEAA